MVSCQRLAIVLDTLFSPRFRLSLCRGLTASSDRGSCPDRFVINKWAQQGADLGICMILELITGEPPCDAGDEVGDLHSRFATRIDESDICQLTPGMAGGVRGCNVGNAFWGQCGLFVMYHGDGLGVRTPVLNGAVQGRKQRLHQRRQLGVLQI